MASYLKSLPSEKQLVKYPKKIRWAVGLLRNEHSNERFRAIDFLRDSKHILSILSLCYVLRNDDYGTVKMAAAEALGQINSRKAVPHLLESIDQKKEEDSSVRGESLSALHSILKEDAFPHLVRVLEEDKDFSVRYRAVCLLNSNLSPLAIKPLLNSLNDSSEKIRKTAGSGLRLLFLTSKLLGKNSLIQGNEHHHLFKAMQFIDPSRHPLSFYKLHQDMQNPALTGNTENFWSLYAKELTAAEQDLKTAESA